jgi:membrane-anchored protein YejM (alkaline phosphatase superfamily)
MVINLLLAEGAEDSLRLGLKTFLTSGLIISSIFILEFIVLKKLYNKTSNKIIHKKTILITILLPFMFILADKFTYAFSDLYNRREVTRYSKIFPLYQPMTIKRFMRKKFNFKLEREDEIKLDNNFTSLDYPKAELTYSDRDKYPNIIWILIDAWRFDMLKEEITPNILEFSKNAMIFSNHYSGGNASRFGVFTLFYAVYGYYWHHFLGERCGPVIIDELKKLDYDFNIISSRKLTSPEFRKTAFIKIPEFIKDKLQGTSVEQRDSLLTLTFIKWLNNRDSSKPFFTFLFYNAAHRPYSYPDSFEKFKPSNKNPNYVTVRKKDALTLLNSYKNAIYFNDSETGKILNVLKKNKMFNNTIVLITGDHGEEFYETGFWGHTSAFSKYQTKTPLILYIPDTEPETVTRLTSHLDVVPTMLELLGCTSKPELYAQGQSLLNERGHDYVVASGWDDCAIIDPATHIVFSFESYKLGSFEVRDKDYRFIHEDRDILKSKRANIMYVLNGFKEFINK